MRCDRRVNKVPPKIYWTLKVILFYSSNSVFTRRANKNVRIIPSDEYLIAFLSFTPEYSVLVTFLPTTRYSILDWFKWFVGEIN